VGLAAIELNSRSDEMTSKVVVAGVGMIQFKKPGTSARYDEMGSQAVRAALADAGWTTATCSRLTPGCLRRFDLRAKGAVTPWA